MRMTKTAIALATLALLGGAAAADLAAEEMIISSWAPPTHAINASLWPSWAEAVEKATEGRITAKIEYGLAPPPAQFDLIIDGAAHATWIFHGYNPGRFVATQLVELPGIEAPSEKLSVAYWKVHQAHLAKADEHQGVKLIGLMTHGPGMLHTRDKISTLDEIAGSKIRIGGGVSSAVGESLGMVGVNVPAPKVYETVSSGVADGVMMPMEGKKGFRLAEIAPYTMIMPGGLYYGSFALIMNQEWFDGLSAEDQAAIESVTGEFLSHLAGTVWDQADADGLTFAQENGNTITTADEAMLADFTSRTQQARQAVLDRIDGLGINAEAAQADLHTLVAE